MFQSSPALYQRGAFENFKGGTMNTSFNPRPRFINAGASQQPAEPGARGVSILARALSTRAQATRIAELTHLPGVSILARALSTRALAAAYAVYRPRFINAGAQASRPLARLIKVSILARALSTRAHPNTRQLSTFLKFQSSPALYQRGRVLRFE